MPTKCFFNLPEEKKIRIVTAAILELSSVTTDLVSINKIVKNADISRGSFYQYFEDKDDLINFILKDILLEIKNLFYQEIVEKSKNIFDVFVLSFQGCIDYGLSTDYSSIFVNFFKSIKFSDDIYRYDFLLENEKKEFFNILKPYLDKGELSINGEENYIILLELLLLIFKQGLTNVFCDIKNKDTYIKNFHTQIEIIKSGVCLNISDLS